MSRYTGPSWKQSRRLGISLSGTGKELARRPYAPGQHGPNSRGKKSEYGFIDVHDQWEFYYGFNASIRVNEKGQAASKIKSAMDAMEKNDVMLYDTILIDESQDLDQDFFESLEFFFVFFIFAFDIDFAHVLLMVFSWDASFFAASNLPFIFFFITAISAFLLNIFLSINDLVSMNSSSAAFI